MNLPRVSQIIAPYSGYNKVPKKILEKAADRGTLIHSACLAMVQKEACKLPFEYAKYAMSFGKFLPQIKSIHSFENRLSDEKWGYTGMYDYLGEVEGYEGTTLFDIKSSYAAKKIWGCQVAAYARLAEIHWEILPKTILVVHLSKEGNAPKLIEYDLEIHLAYFKAMCEMYHLFKPDDQEFMYD